MATTSNWQWFSLVLRSQTQRCFNPNHLNSTAYEFLKLKTNRLKDNKLKPFICFMINLHKKPTKLMNFILIQIRINL